MEPISSKPITFKQSMMGFFEKITQFTAAFLEAAYINLFSILLLAIIYYFYWQFDQGKDLLLTLNQQNDVQIGFFFITLITLASICWYIPKLCYKDKKKKATNKTQHRDSSPNFMDDAVESRGFEALPGEVPSIPSDETEEASPASKRSSLLPDVFFEDVAQHTVESYYQEKGYFSEEEEMIDTEEDIELPSRGFETIEEGEAPTIQEEQLSMDRDQGPHKQWKQDSMIPLSESSEERMDRYRILFKENLPRLLGSMVPFVVAFGMLNVLQEFLKYNRIPAYIWLILIFAIMSYLGYKFNSAYFAKQQKDDPFFDKKVSRVFGMAGLGILAILIYLMIDNKGDLYELYSLFLATLLVGSSFFFITIIRKPFAKYIYKSFQKQIDAMSLVPVNWVLVTIFFFSLALAIFYLVLNFWPALSQQFNPLICANLAFIFYIGILYFLRVRGARTNIDWVSIFLLVCLILYLVNSKDRHHRITLVEDERNVDTRMELPTYFDTWLSERTAYIESVLDSSGETSYPVFVVSSEGGGSRAAYWTILSHQALQEANSAYFDKHLFAMTGASGGNTGNSSYLTMRRSGLPVESIQPSAKGMFQQNFLSSSITQFLGIDIWKNMFRLGGKDRAKSLEKEWTYQLAKVTGEYGPTVKEYWNQSFLSLWYAPESPQLVPYRPLPPLLLINATHVQRGSHGVFSPVKLSPAYYKGKDLLASISEIEAHVGKSVPLKTANLLNASFPYVNPAGVIEGVGNYVDAGYYDNYGAQTAISLLEELTAIRDQAPDSSLAKRIQFVSVLIRNSTVDGDAEAYSDLPYIQLRAPLKTLGNIRSAVNSHNRWELSQVADQSFEINLLPREEIDVIKGNDTIQPAIPLARYLSDLALVAMDSSIKQLKAFSPRLINRAPVQESRSFEYGRPPLEVEKRGDVRKVQMLLEAFE